MRIKYSPTGGEELINAEISLTGGAMGGGGGGVGQNGSHISRPAGYTG